MPKFVSGSSGHIYSHDKLTQEEDEILAVISGTSTTTATAATTNTATSSTSTGDRKPSAINKKGTKEKQKSSLDLFKEELRRLNEERDEQRNKLKNSLNSSTTTTSSSLTPSTSTHSSSDKHQYPIAKPPPPPLPPVPVPLKPDPRCPTALTLQVNLNPNRDRDSSGGGSFDTGDPTTTNLYLGNLNPIVTENDLCDIFGKFGPLASIKIMWPRTDEERARNRNSGFVAYMSRVDAERALKTLNGMEYKNYELKLGWGKAVPLPKNPVFIPKELIEFMARPLAQSSGLPFNSQLHPSDLARGYTVPKPWPRPVDFHQQQQQQQQQVSLDVIKTQQDIYQEFAEVLQRSTVYVQVPQDSALLELIHHTIDCALREGPIYEAMLIARESENPGYKFLHDNTCPEHIYYRWKLYSVLHGEDPNVWRTETFRMFEGGPMWQPPPLNPFADGMPLELVEQLTGINKQILTSDGVLCGARKMQISSEPVPPTLGTSDSAPTTGGSCLKFKGKFGPELVAKLNEMLVNLTPTRSSIGAAMLFCIQHSDAADEIIQCFEQLQSSPSLAYKVRIAQLFLISDILHNSSAAVTNASFYRKGFQAKLVGIFGGLRDYMQTIEDRHKADRFKQKILSVLSAWGYFHMYESKFLLQLSNIFLNITTTSEQQHNNNSEQEKESQSSASLQVTGEGSARLSSVEAQLDGEPVDEQVLVQCLEERGLSLRWYKTLDLSDDEFEETTASEIIDAKQRSRSPATPTPQREDQATTTVARFKASKWELINEDQERKSPPARLISQPIHTRAVPVKDLSSQKVGSPDYEDQSPSGSSTSNGTN